MEPTTSGVVKGKALLQRKRPAPRNRVKKHIFGDIGCTFKLCAIGLLFILRSVRSRNLVRRRKVPTFRRRVKVLLLVRHFVKALLPTKPPAKPDAPPVNAMLVDNILDNLPESTRRAMAVLPAPLVEGGVDTEAPVIDMMNALVHDNSVLHKGNNNKWIVTNLESHSNTMNLSISW